MSLSMSPRAIAGTGRFPGNIISKQNLIVFCKKNTRRSSMNALREVLGETPAAFGGRSSMGHAPIT